VGEATPGFGAFLDGIQRSVVAWYDGDVIPIVHATTAAVIRVRTDRVLRTWGAGSRVERCVYLPVTRVQPGLVDALTTAGFSVVDTLGGSDGASEGHPLELVALAREAVKRRREAAEESLVAQWCSTEQAPLYVDGAIRSFGERARREIAVGVVKSHNTVYVAAAGVPVLARLRAGQRSTAVRIDTRPGVPVASWYLRLHPSGGGDPFGGLVRVEIADSAFSTERADLVSRWILAERDPVALPDARWRVMAYGIRDCEEYLRALTT
jgi:hypothetical protein